MKKIYFLLIASILLGFSCKKDDYGNSVTHYKTIGKGYIFERDSNKPVKGVKIIVKYCTNITSCYEGLGFMGTEDIAQETFTTDENGYYQFRFAKRVNGYKVNSYRFGVEADPVLPPRPPLHEWCVDASNNYPSNFMYPSDIKGKEVILFDTMKYFLHPF